MSTDSEPEQDDEDKTVKEEKEDANCSLASSTDMGSSTADSTWDISKMAKQIEAELEDEKTRTRNPSIGSRSRSSSNSSRDRRSSRSSSSSSSRGHSESEEEDLDKLTTSAIAHEVSEMRSRKRAIVADLDSEDEEDEENDKDQKGVEEDVKSTSFVTVASTSTAAASEDEGINLTETEGGSSSSRMSSSSMVDLGEERYSEGFLVWGKLKGYSYWPGVITIDPVDAVTTKLNDVKGQQLLKRSSVRSHVHFIGYENQRAWLPESALLEFRGLEEYDKMFGDVKGAKRKEYYATKKYQAKFEKAVKQAEKVLVLPFPQRLQKLGFVYVAVAPDFRTAAEKKLIQSPSSIKVENSPTPEAKSPTKSRERSISGRRPSWSPKKKLKTERSSSTEENSTSESFDKFNGSEDKGIFSASMSSSSAAVTSPSKQKKPQQRRRRSPKKSSAKTVKTVERKSSTGSVVRVSSPEPEGVILDINGDDDEFASENEENNDDDNVFVENGGSDRFVPRLGSLVWGRMAGFPFWPCFITKAPDGEFMRRSAKVTNHHVQFFNWNNESGWVGKVLPWCTLEEFRLRSQEAAKSKSLSQSEWKKAWCPQGKMMEQKWTLAYQEAHSTAHMSRKERYHRLVVFYRSKIGFDASTYVPTMAARGRKRSREEEDKNDVNGVVDKGGKKLKRRCRKPKSKPISGRAISIPESDLPPGWTMKGGEFISPDGVTYPNFRDLVRHLFQQNVGSGPQIRRRRSYSCCSCSAENDEDGSSSPGWLLEATDRIRYVVREKAVLEAGLLDGRITSVQDDSLPSNWMVKKYTGSGSAKTEMLYYSPKGDCLTSKFEVANYMETKGHPSNELEQLLSAVAAGTTMNRSNGSSKSRRKQESSKVLFTINLSRNTAEEFLHHPILGKAVMACNWSVEIVQLPDVFLRHPSVSVKENDNEMIISDLYTGEFIAKKIIYD